MNRIISFHYNAVYQVKREKSEDMKRVIRCPKQIKIGQTTKNDRQNTTQKIKVESHET